MNAFTTTAATFLSRYSDNLLKDQCEQALSGTTRGDESVACSLISAAISLMDSFKEEDFLVCGLHRINGSMIQQQKAVKVLEHPSCIELKIMMLNELSAEDKAGCLRLLLRKLPDPLFPYCQRTALADITESIRTGKLCNESALKALQILVFFIPESSKLCLKKLLAHLNDVVSNSEANKMGVENIALMFASAVFPVLEEADSMEAIKSDVENMCRLFPILLRYSSELFYLPDELINTLESSMQKHAEEDTLWECSSPVVSEDPELVMSETFSQRSTPTRSTTDLELAKLMAEIYSMPEGPAKIQLLKRMKHNQRQQLGIPKKQSVFAKLIRKTKK